MSSRRQVSTVVARHRAGMRGARAAVLRWPILIGLVLVALLSVREARPCSCGPVSAPRTALENATAVFSGEIVARRDLDLTEGGFPMAHAYTVRVYRAWKGVAREMVEIGTSSNPIACGTSFALGGEYLFYVGGGGVLGATSGDVGRVTRTQDRPPFWTSSCARNVPLGYAEKEDLRVLGVPTWVNRTHRASLLSEELWEASRQGDVATIRQLVRDGHDVNGKPRYHDGTALLAAVRGRHSEAVAALLAAGASIDALNNETTALVEAARLADAATAQLLLAGGADANDSRPRSLPLVVAAEVGAGEVVALLIEAGAEVEGHALTVAARKGHLSVVERLVPLVSARTVGPSRIGLPSGTALLGEPLWAAAKGGHLEIVDRLIASGADVNWALSTGKSTLTVAAENGHSDVVRRLLTAGAAVDDEELTAASSLDEELLRLLMAQRTGSDDLEVTGEMLVQAARSAQSGSLRTLLERKPDVDAPGRNGETALAVAATHGRAGAMSALLEAGADIDRTTNSGWTALMKAIWGEQEGAVKFLVSRGADPNAGDSDVVDALILAVRWSREGLAENRRTGARVVNLLIGAGANVNMVLTGRRDLPGSGTALVQAIYHRDLEMVRRLLDAGADPRLGGALCAATWRGSVEISNLLLEGGASIDSEECAPLVLAADSKEIDLVTRLLELGADPKRPSPDRRGGTAIHKAASDGSADIVRLLIEHGADPDATIPGGFRPLHLAVRGRSIETARVLLDAGADIDARRDDGWTPLMCALPQGYRHVAERGRRRQGDPDWIAPELAMIEFLLEVGADVEAVDRRGRTVVDMAEEIGDSEAVALLLRR